MDDRMPKSLMIITVGTSMLSNTGGDRKIKESLDSFKNSLDEKWKKYQRNNTQEIIQATACLVKKNLIDKGLLSRELGFRENLEGKAKDALPQEISHLALRVSNARKNNETVSEFDVYLLASDSPKGKFCAETIAEVLRQSKEDTDLLKPYSVAQVIPIEGLSVEPGESEGESNSELFRNTGIPNLIGNIIEIVNKSTEAPEAILNFTGGFKGAIPYTTLAMLFAEHENVSMEYLYGESDQIIRLPRYPVGLDFTLWHREANLLKAAARHSSYRDAMDPRMSAVLEEEGNSPTSLPSILRAKYEDQLKTDPLQSFSEKVVTQFLERDKSLADCLKSLIRETGPNIWVGDKLKMAAEHAERHHHDLLELAQLLLTPIANECIGDKRPFLTQEERFVLLSALLLHDCGHTLDALPLKDRQDKLVPLFKSEIREYHHFLAYHRLGIEQARADLQWQPPCQDLTDAVRWLCVYHRRRTGWDKESKPEPAPCPYLDLEVGTPCNPCNELDKILNRFNHNLDFPKLVFLIRLIDGCDNQNRRVGYENLSKLTEHAFDQDSKTLEQRLRQILPAASALCAGLVGGEGAAALCFLNATKTWLDADAGKDRPDFGPFKGIRQLFARDLALGNGDEKRRAAMAIWTEVAAIFDEYCLCHHQEIHFLKHQAVSRITVLPGDDFDAGKKWHFTVTLAANTAMTEKLDDTAFAQKFSKELDGASTLRNWLESEVVSEICEKDRPNIMIDYLAKAAQRAIQFDFKWESANEPFKKLSAAGNGA